MTHPTLLVVAKAPVPGFAKTRLAATIGPAAAADLAAAALLDTLATASAVGWPVVVALTGELDRAARSVELGEALAGVTVVPQTGDGLGERLARAHADADRGHGVVQVGMDTPQISVEDYLAAGAVVGLGRAVIGPATDGGWWLLGLPDSAAATALIDVPMSTADTGAATLAALGGDPVRLRELRDIDTWNDAVEVAGALPGSRTASAVAALQEVRG